MVFRTMTLRRLSIVLAFGLLTGVNCDGGPVSPGRFGLARARAQWEAAQIADYTVESRIACFCPGHLHSWTKLAVQANHVISADPLEPLPPGAVPSLSGWKTVVELFDFIEESASNTTYEDVDVRYHATLGYPERILVTCRRNVSDCGVSYELRSLVHWQVAGKASNPEGTRQTAEGKNENIGRSENALR
jgi:hypothetical protein